MTGHLGKLLCVRVDVLVGMINFPLITESSVLIRRCGSVLMIQEFLHTIGILSTKHELILFYFEHAHTDVGSIHI